MKNFFLIFITYMGLSITASGQENSEYAGTYIQGTDRHVITELTIYEDGTFYLKTPDPVFFYNAESYENTGAWITEGEQIILNPEKSPRETQVTLNEQIVGELGDSVRIRINYILQEYQEERLISSTPFTFDELRLFINKKGSYYTLVQEEKIRICSFAHKIRHQVIVDSTQSITLPHKKELERIGIITYGFDDIEWFPIDNVLSNSFEIHITQPIDVERVPRSRPIIIKNERAFLYSNRKGELSTLPGYGLWKRE